MDIWLRHEQRHVAHSPCRNLALPFLVALMLHILVLSQFGKQPGYEHHKASRPLTVRLIAEPAPAVAVHTPPRASQSASQGKRSVLTSDASDVRLDMDQIRGQARAYASALYARSSPALTIEGDYYGSYSGDDSGVFFFHLGRDGRGSGTGESHSFGIPFLISGSVDADGKLQMQGNGVAGEARFSGKLDMRSGEVAGSWDVPGMLQGSFSGRRGTSGAVRR